MRLLEEADDNRVTQCTQNAGQKQGPMRILLQKHSDSQLFTDDPRSPQWILLNLFLYIFKNPTLKETQFLLNG